MKFITIFLVFFLVEFYAHGQYIARWDGSTRGARITCATFKYLRDTFQEYNVFVKITSEQFRIKNRLYKKFYFGNDSTQFVGYIRVGGDTVFFRQDPASEEIPFLSFVHLHPGFQTSLGRQNSWFDDAVIKADSSLITKDTTNALAFNIKTLYYNNPDASYPTYIIIDRTGILAIGMKTEYGFMAECKCKSEQRGG